MTRPKLLDAVNKYYNDCENELLSAANKFISAHGGSAVVIGPTVVIQMPDDAQHVYYLGIKFTGKKPTVKT